MAARGLLDYLRAAGVLFRGILGNFLIFVPYLLAIALAVAAANFFNKPAPFILAKVLLALFVLWVLFFLVLTPVFRIARYRKSMSTGSDSSVEQRDIYERSFGGLLLAILAVAGLESLPGLLDIFHGAVFEADVGWPTVASAIAAATAALSVVPKILSVLGKGIARKIALGAIGILGFALPLLFVLFVADFIVFSPPRDWTEDLKVAGYAFPAAIFLTVGLGMALRTFKLKKDAFPIAMLLIGALGLLGIGIYADDKVEKCCLGESNASHLTEALVELKQRPAELHALIEDVAAHPGVLLADIEEWLDGNRAHLTMKRDFFRQPPPIRIEDDEISVDDAYREYRAKKIAFYDLEEGSDPKPADLLAELLQELLDEIRNESHNVEGLSPVITLVDAIDPVSPDLPVEQSVSLLKALYGLYHQVATLQDLFASPSPPEFAAKLSTLVFPGPYSDIDSLPQFQAELKGAQESLAVWADRLKEVQTEIENVAPYAPSNSFINGVEKLANRPYSKFRGLLDRWEDHRKEAEDWRRSLLDESEVQGQRLDVLLRELGSVGYTDPDQYMLVEFSHDIRQFAVQHPDEANALTRQTRHLYRRSAILGNLSTARSLEEVTVKSVSLRDDDLKLVRGKSYLDCKEQLSGFVEFLTTALSSFGYDRDCEWKWASDPEEYTDGPVLTEEHPDYPHLSGLDGFIYVDDALYGGAINALLLRDEIVATAILSEQDSAFSATPIAMRVRENYFWPKFTFVGLLAIQLWVLCWLAVDVNLTSIHGLYRDRLASAFLVGEDTKGNIHIEKDLNLMEICNYEAGSVAPYHLINVALNLQGSNATGLRDRQSDFFIFSKRFIGGRLTGYCRSEHMERVFPQMDLATAMAISAAAASPNMGRGTSPALVAFMTLLNIRLGFWVPNPGQLESWRQRIGGEKTAENSGPGGFSFEQVFRDEVTELKARWAQLASKRDAPTDQKNVRKFQPTTKPALEHGLVGIGYSGGGIRSAALNLGITQALHQRGVFDHIDYMSTVSGGGYLGSSISTIMRRTDIGKTPLAKVGEDEDEAQDSVGQLFRWRVRPAALLREILSKLDETSRLVNVSDGGHIENLAGIELLRRRCKYIIIGDGEADPDHHFNGLATLIQTARIDLEVDIKIDAAPLRLNKERLCRAHWAIGRIRYPKEQNRGYLLYLKSSITGDEDEVIKHYRNKNPSFPHESTADQFFGEGQFEAYRSLGQHIGERALGIDTGRGDAATEKTEAPKQAEASPTNEDKMSFVDLHNWFDELWHARESSIEKPGDS